MSNLTSSSSSSPTAVGSTVHHSPFSSSSSSSTIPYFTTRPTAHMHQYPLGYNDEENGSESSIFKKGYSIINDAVGSSNGSNASNEETLLNTKDDDTSTNNYHQLSKPQVVSPVSINYFTNPLSSLEASLRPSIHNVSFQPYSDRGPSMILLHGDSSKQPQPPLPHHQSLVFPTTSTVPSSHGLILATTQQTSPVIVDPVPFTTFATTTSSSSSSFSSAVPLPILTTGYPNLSNSSSSSTTNISMGTVLPYIGPPPMKIMTPQKRSTGGISMYYADDLVTAHPSSIDDSVASNSLRSITNEYNTGATTTTPEVPIATTPWSPPIGTTTTSSSSDGGKLTRSITPPNSYGFPPNNPNNNDYYNYTGIYVPPRTTTTVPLERSSNIIPSSLPLPINTSSIQPTMHRTPTKSFNAMVHSTTDEKATSLSVVPSSIILSTEKSFRKEGTISSSASSASSAVIQEKMVKSTTKQSGNTPRKGKITGTNTVDEPSVLSLSTLSSSSSTPSARVKLKPTQSVLPLQSFVNEPSTLLAHDGTTVIRHKVGKRTCTSEYRGVALAKNKFWRVQVSFGGKRISVGHFRTEIIAARAYDCVVRIIKQGSSKLSAQLNFPNEVNRPLECPDEIKAEVEDAIVDVLLIPDLDPRVVEGITQLTKSQRGTSPLLSPDIFKQVELRKAGRPKPRRYVQGDVVSESNDDEDDDGEQQDNNDEDEDGENGDEIDDEEETNGTVILNTTGLNRRTTKKRKNYSDDEETNETMNTRSTITPPKLSSRSTDINIRSSTRRRRGE